MTTEKRYPSTEAVASFRVAVALAPGFAEVYHNRAMALVACGVSNQDIASRLFLSYKTVKNHLNRIFAKLGVGTRSEGLCSPESDGLSQCGLHI